jgi:hypothetical protein
MLKITNDARKAGLDFRLIDPSAPDFPGSKENLLVARVKAIYDAWQKPTAARSSSSATCPFPRRRAARRPRSSPSARRTAASIVRGRRVSLEGAPEELEFVLAKQIKEGTRNTLEGYKVVELRTGRTVGAAERSAEALEQAKKAIARTRRPCRTDRRGADQRGSRHDEAEQEPTPPPKPRARRTRSTSTSSWRASPISRSTTT